jgi:hypothetical protein
LKVGTAHPRTAAPSVHAAFAELHVKRAVELDLRQRIDDLIVLVRLVAKH